MPVLDGSMVQVKHGRCRTVRLCVLLPDPPHVLLGRLLTDAHARATDLIDIPVGYNRSVRVSCALSADRSGAS